uniref:Copia protein n=1 Tax=Tanacetum cinerariifolium TaxID=118510 RepID=A0A6L2L0V4_TANCI|nr:copia protein [Tanacetum cinerariifolium]
MSQQQKPNLSGGHGCGGQPRKNEASVSGALELGNINGDTLQALVNLLNSQKSSNENMTCKILDHLTWIINTGASQHMVGNLRCLTKVRDVVSCLMGLPNRDQAVATKSGTMNLDGKIKLLNVLYDYTSRIQIGAGELRERLYYFYSAASASTLNKFKDVLFDLWHKRLGHPSAKIVELLPDFGSRSTSNLVNKGGYRTPSSCGASYFLTIVDDYSRTGVVKNSNVNQNIDVGESNNTNNNIRSSRYDVEATVGVGLTSNESVGYVNCTEEEYLGRGQRNKQPSVPITLGSEPTRFFEAVQHQCWREAMKKELNALENNGTWTCETLPPGKKVIGSKWVFKINYNSNGTIERHKARLVILGNNKVEGIDYNETFAPVAKMVTIHTFHVVATARNWELHQMDVHNTFLYGDLEEEVYMKLPQGLKSSRLRMEATLRVVRYLKGCPGQGILLHIDNDLKLYELCDSDWAACPLTRLSLTGYFVQLGNSLISRKTKKQHTVSQSSAEAEYRSMATITCELKWLKALLLSLRFSHSCPIKLYCDSQAAFHIAANLVFHERTKHIEVDCHFIRDEILRGIIQPAYVPV